MSPFTKVHGKVFFKLMNELPLQDINFCVTAFVLHKPVPILYQLYITFITGKKGNKAILILE